jgi:hypothetical protein
MKKFSIFLLAILLCSGRLAAEETVTIGTGESTVRGLMIGGYYLYERHAVLYKQSELVNINYSEITSGNITKVAFYITSAAAPTPERKIKIYIKNVALTNLSGQNWNTLATGTTLVYDKTGTDIVITENAWNVFEFTTPFAYTGGNILVMTDTESQGNESTFARYTTSTSNHLHARDDNGIPTSSTTDNNRANIRFTFSTVTGTETVPSYCEPAGADTRYLSSVSATTDGMSDFSKTYTASSGGYHNYSASDTIVSFEGAGTSVTLMQNTGTALFFCWVDWNGDFYFDAATEKVFETTDYNNQVTASLNVPANTPAGDYRLRTGSSRNGAITPCTYGSSADYKDYTLRVIPVPSCTKPKNLTVQNTTPTSAEIMFVKSNTDDYEYLVTLPNATIASLDNLTPVEVTERPFTVTALTDGNVPFDANVVYKIWVRAICETEKSLWVATTFLTTCGTETSFPWTYGFEDLLAANTLSQCWKATKFGASGKIGTQIANAADNRLAHSGTRAIYFKSEANDSITSPLFELAEGTKYRFAFWYITDGNNGWLSLKANVYDASSGNELKTGAALTEIKNTDYRRYELDFTPEADGTYYFKIICNSTNTARYLTIDDVELREVLDKDIATTDIVSSVGTNAVNKTVADFSVSIKNNGLQEQINIPVKLEIDGVVSPEVKNIASLAADASAQVTFEGVDISAATTKTFNIRAFVALDGDENKANDTTVLSLTNEIIEMCALGVVAGKAESSNTTMPLTAGTKYSYTQQIYWKNTINANIGEDIVAISFYYNASDVISDIPVVVYLGNTTETFFSTETKWVPYSKLTRVYAGNITVSRGWVTIPTVPFEYEGDNIVVAIDMNSNFTASYIFVSTLYNENRGLYAGRADDILPSSPPSGTPTRNIPDIKLNICPSLCPRPVVSLEYTTDTTATVAWTHPTSSNFKIEWGTEGFTPGTNTGIDSASTSQTRYTIENLLPYSNYDVYVKADCGNENGQSRWTLLYFTTECETVVVTEENLYLEGFETDDLNCWTLRTEGNVMTIQIVEPSNPFAPIAATDGNYIWATYGNAGEKSYLISPFFDVSALSSPVLSLRHAEIDYHDASEQLRVYYRTSYAAEWTLLPNMVFTTASGWRTTQTALPKAVTLCQFKFEITGGDGKGVVLDNIEFLNNYISVITNDATDVGTSSATLNKTVTSDFEQITEEGFEYRRALPANGNWSFSTSGLLTNLISATKYEFKAYAKTASGTYYGETLNFTTLSLLGTDEVWAENITLYPNPASETATLELGASNAAVKVEVTDLAGRTVAVYNAGATENQLNINVAHLAKGAYLIKIISDKGIVTRKLVVN